MEEKLLRLEIRGRVQAVFYRASMADEACRLGVRGWVRNRRDGSVEAMVSGPAQAVDRLVAWAQRGPAGAQVTEVQVHPGEGCFAGFEARPTV